jgi:hypothetical protein
LSQRGASEVHPETIRAFPPRFSHALVHARVPLMAVLPEKDGMAALDCCWRAARRDGFQPGWSQELPRRLHCLPFWPTRARGRRDPPFGRASWFAWRVGRHQAWGMAASLPVAGAVHAARQARGAYTLPGSSTTGRPLHLPHRQQPLPQQPASTSHEQCHRSDATQGTYYERQKSTPPFVLHAGGMVHCRAAGGRC